MDLAPVVIFVYNRLEHVKITIEHLKNNDLANKSDVIIFSDKEDGKENRAEVLEVRNYIKELEKTKWFHSVTIRLAEKHLGLANSVINGVSEVVESAGKVIVVEDDLITAKSFLRYMNEALNYYQNDNKVWSVSGYTLQLHKLKRYHHDVYASWRGSSWGWATWKDRWSKVDWQVSDFADFICSEKKVKEFNRGGEDMTELLRRQLQGQSDSWAIRWNYQQYKENMLTIFPTKSQVKNVGWDGSGKNCGQSILKIFDTKIEEFPEKIVLEKCKVNNVIMKQTRMAYSKSLFKRILFVCGKIF